MACHYTERGTMPIVVGGYYTDSLRYMNRYMCKLIEHNAETHTCTMLREGGGKFWVSEEQLTHWHLVLRPEAVNNR